MSQFIEVIEFLDNSGQLLASRFPQNGSGDIKYGAQLIVQQNQAAIFVKDGKYLDIFTAGRHNLVTENIPILTKLLSAAYDFKSPFRACVYFISLKNYAGLKWGTPEPVLFKDSEFDYVRLRARGTYTIKISDPGLFLGKIVGTAGLFSISQLEDFLRNVIVSQFFDALGSNITSVLDLPKLYEELGLAVLSQVKDALLKYGVELTELRILAITLPEEVQKAIDERSSIAAAGDLNRYAKFKAAKAIGDFAAKPSSAGSAAADIGIGVAIGQAMAESLKAAPSIPASASSNTASIQPANEAVCRKCNTQNPKTAKFCMNCGEKTVPAGYCNACSTQNPPGAKFCMNCGGGLA